MIFRNVFFWMFSVVVLLTSCNNRQDDDNDIGVIDTIDNIQDLNIDAWFTFESILPLKANDSSLINFIGKVYIVTNGYVLWDNFEHNIFKYDKSGHCLWKITNKGRGPGEFSRINDICLDASEEYLYVLDGMDQSKVIKYEITSGQYVTEHKIALKAYAFYQFDHGGFAFATGNNRIENVEHPNSQLALTDSSFRIVHTGIGFDDRWQGISINNGSSYFFPIGKDSVLFTPQLPEIGDVYLLTPETINPYFRFENQNSDLINKAKSISVSKVKEWLDDNLVEYNISEFWHQANKVHFYVTSNNSNREVLCDLSTGKCYSRPTNQHTDRHAYFAPKPVLGFKSNGLFVNVLPAFAIKDKQYEVIASLDTIEENDNPVLVFYRINN